MSADFLAAPFLLIAILTGRKIPLQVFRAWPAHQLKLMPI